MTLANKISILRIILIPVFVICLLKRQTFPYAYYWAVGIFTFAVLTDFLDGLAARILLENERVGQIGLYVRGFDIDPARCRPTLTKSVPILEQ